MIPLRKRVIEALEIRGASPKTLKHWRPGWTSGRYLLSGGQRAREESAGS